MWRSPMWTRRSSWRAPGNWRRKRAGHYHRAVIGDGDDRIVPSAGHPGQSAIDDVVADQIAGVLHHVAASGRAVDVDAAGVQICRANAAVGDGAAGEITAALQ